MVKRILHQRRLLKPEVILLLLQHYAIYANSQGKKINSQHRKPHFYYGVTSLKTLSSVKFIWRADLTKLLEHKCSWRGWFHSKWWKYIWLPQQLSFSWDGASNFQNEAGNTQMNNWGYLIIFFVRVGSHVWSQRALVSCSDVQITRQHKKKRKWALFGVVFNQFNHSERLQKGTLPLSSSHPGSGLWHTLIHMSTRCRAPT